MADSTPLLSHCDSAESEISGTVKHVLPTLDDTIERCLGNFGWAQFLQAVLVSFAWAFDAQQTFISIFTDAEPTWHCTQLSDESCNNLVSNICQLPKNSWEWDWPIHTSIVSEWALECSGSLITGLPASSFFMGCLVGGLSLATLADSSLGRKNMLFLSCLLMSLAGILTVFSTNIWIYSALRFITGFGRGTIGTCALVLSTELVGKRWRGQVGVIGFFCFTLGFLSLPAIAYINRGSSWRNIYLYTSIPTIFYCLLVHFLVRESPRWLFVKGRKEDAVKTLKSMASVSHSSLTLSFSGLTFQQTDTWNNNDVDLFSVVKILVEKKWAFQRLLAVMAAGFGIGMVYYGMPLGVGNLAFNLYLSVTLNALSELPASLVTFFLIGKLNRKSGIIFFSLVSAVCSILCVVLSNIDQWVTSGVQIGLELMSFFSACTAFNVLLIYTIELFPTCVRNSAISMLRLALVLGGAVCPVLVAAGRKNGFMSYGVFGIMIGFCGLFVVCLPETRGGTLCDTMDEEEHKERTSCNNIGVSNGV